MNRQMCLGVVLLSLFTVSYVAARVRPRAGTLLTVIAIVAAVSQSIAVGPAASTFRIWRLPSRRLQQL